VDQLGEKSVYCYINDQMAYSLYTRRETCEDSENYCVMSNQGLEVFCRAVCTSFKNDLAIYSGDMNTGDNDDIANYGKHS
jgi:hypothetical protein